MVLLKALGFNEIPGARCFKYLTVHNGAQLICAKYPQKFRALQNLCANMQPQSGDDARARALLVEAHSLSEEMGMHGLIKRIDELRTANIGSKQ